MLIIRFVLIASLVATAFAQVASSQGSAPGPRLLVIIVVDQMRHDYLVRMAPQWRHGFRRLLDEGAVFENNRYPYLNTVTCAGHATIGTGSFPSTHGIIMNEWWQRGAGRRMSCTDDARVTAVPYAGKPESIGHSAHRLRAATLADRIRERSPEARVVAMSMKPRSTVMLAGHGGTAVTWLSDANYWGTSTAYGEAPVPVIASYVGAHPLDAERATVWNRVNDLSAYAGEDDGAGERGPRGWGPTFPHPLTGNPGTPAERFYDLWERSPFSDAYLGRMAAATIREFKLGQRNVVDFLAVSFSAVDYVGHDFGPESQEVQDTLVRMDRTLGDLLGVLDATVGRDRYALGLSADHGVAPIPEARTAAGRDGGRIAARTVRAAIEQAMAPFGPGPHTALVEYTEIYLTDSSMAIVRQKPEAERAVIEAVSALPGVLRVMRSDGLATRRGSTDPIERAAAYSHFPGESGDFQLVPKPYWITTESSAATHGTMHDYDQHVPLIFLGGAFKPGRYAEPSTPADLAPTLAALAGIPMPGADGTPRTMAVRR
jgi:predicted AlkP superfamily pyrophosphatase or phosphodiesterase